VFLLRDKNCLKTIVCAKFGTQYTAYKAENINQHITKYNKFKALSPNTCHTSRDVSHVHVFLEMLIILAPACLNVLIFDSPSNNFNEVLMLHQYKRIESMIYLLVLKHKNKLEIQ
jgi:hypothetical protein